MTDKQKTFTAKQFHENPRDVYRAAEKAAVTITHRFYGEFTLTSQFCKKEKGESL